MSKEYDESPTIASWFPGHMAAGAREILAVAELVDLAIEVRDARLPRSTKVSSLQPKLLNKPTIVVLNREDLANEAATKEWLYHIAASGGGSFATQGTRAATLSALRKAVLSYPKRRSKVRIAVIGAPNVGKSSIINALVRRKRAATRNLPGVTRHPVWIALDRQTDLLDTPGTLAPKIQDPTARWQLALCGILPESVFDPRDVVECLLQWLARNKGAILGAPSLETFALRRGMLRRGGKLDLDNAARAYVTAFREGHFGRITFEPLEK